MHEHFFFYLHIITHEISERAIQITRVEQEMKTYHRHIFIYNKLYFQTQIWFACLSSHSIFLPFDFNDYQGEDLDNDLADCVIMNKK